MGVVLANLARVARLAALAALVPLAACGGAPEEETSSDSGESAFTGTPNEDVGQFFMIEHFGVVAEGYADVHDMIKKKNLGAVILWNPTQASGEVAGQMVARYAASATASRHPELFVAADQEEHGTQRFKSRNGFTDLASGDALGRAVARAGDARVCELHARITSREMAAAGLNMSLGTVSDVYTRDSGTPGMFRTRAVSSDPAVVTSCIRAMTKAYGEEGHVVFVTKHFPGLGNASGNTDVDPSVRTYSDTKAEMETELSPYRAATGEVNRAGTWPLFGAMISHASYEILDGSKSPATLSPVILEDLLRSEPSSAIHGKDKAGADVSFAGMGLKGITVSDAFWTWGAMKNLGPTEKRRMMARSFLAGMDVLMIAKADFNGAWDYFQMLLAGQLPEAEQAALVAATGEADFGTVQRKFRARVAQSAERVKAAKTAVGPSASFRKPGAPKNASEDLVAEYQRLVAP